MSGGFVELSARSSFSFLRGASHPEEMIERANALGLAGMTLCDRDGLYGIARAHARAKGLGQAFHMGAELPLALSERELQTGYADAILGPLSDKQRRLLLPSARPNALRKRLLAADAGASPALRGRAILEPPRPQVERPRAWASSSPGREG